MSSVVIEEKNPLKQGLKQTRRNYFDKKCRIEEKNPLKQGLKPNSSGHTRERSQH